MHGPTASARSNTRSATRMTSDDAPSGERATLTNNRLDSPAASGRAPCLPFDVFEATSSLSVHPPQPRFHHKDAPTTTRHANRSATFPSPRGSSLRLPRRTREACYSWRPRRPSLATTASPSVVVLTVSLVIASAPPTHLRDGTLPEARRVERLVLLRRRRGLPVHESTLERLVIRLQRHRQPDLVVEKRLRGEFAHVQAHARASPLLEHATPFQ